MALHQAGRAFVGLGEELRIRMVVVRYGRLVDVRTGQLACERRCTGQILRAFWRHR